MNATRRLVVALVVVVAAAGCSAGGGGHAGTTATTQPPAPGANIDPNANGVITGPINRSKTVVSQLNQQQSQEDGSGSS